MALYKRRNSSYWWLDFEFETERHQLSTKCRNKRDAEKFAAAYRTGLANGKVNLRIKKIVPTLAAAIAEFLAWSRLHQRQSTFRRYETSSKAPLRYFGTSKKVTEIDRADYEKYVAWRSIQKKIAPVRKLAKNPAAIGKKGLRPATINRELAFLRIVLNRQVDADILHKNPLSRFKFLPENNDQMRVLDLQEERRYLMACSQPLRDVAGLMLQTGMRPSEILKLKTADVNLERGYVRILSGKTASAKRKVPLSSTAAKILSQRIANTKGDLVFPGGRSGKAGKPVVKLSNAHNAAVARSKIKPCRLYSLRHTFATRFTESGGDLVTLKDLLGHSRLVMVLRYAHPSETHHREAMDRFDEYQNLRRRAAAVM